MGGPHDDAAWVYTRSGRYLEPAGQQAGGHRYDTICGFEYFGYSIALSSDGNTAIVGGPDDCDDEGDEIGAAWIFTRIGGIWTQQGAKVVGSGSMGTTGQGWSVALSADGNTAIVGGSYDNAVVGAAWVYTRSGGVWTQQGPKLVGSGAVGGARQGFSVALSADGDTAIVGGAFDDTDAVNNGIGAAWVYTRSEGVPRPSRVPSWSARAR